MRSSYLWRTASLVSLCCFSAAHAQDAGGPITIEEIVVTAERRSETLQRSSVAMEVVSAEVAQAVTEPLDLTSVAPGVQVGVVGPQPQVYIRGVGDQTGNSRGQGAVAFNVDGVYYGRGTAVGPSMFDIERIEILKGPQGTLYGRNASGGAVNIITTAPKIGEFGGYASGEAGSYELRRGNAAVNIPLGSAAALRLAGQAVKRDGYLSDDSQDEDSQSFRARLLWEPTEQISLLFSGDVSHVGGIGGGYGILPVTNGDPWRGARAQPLPWRYQFTPATAPLTTPNDASMDSDNRGLSLEANVDLGFATLTLIPAWRKQEQVAVYYAADFRYAEDADSEQVSGEARLSKDTDRIKWVAGLYYFNEDQDIIFTAAQSSLRAGDTTSTREAWAAFAQATASVTDRFRVIAGGRYTEETVDAIYGNGTGAIGHLPYVRTTPITTIPTIESARSNYKVGAEFDVAENSMLFATFATGFKAGGFIPTARCGPNIYKPETLEAFTLGMRNRFLDNRLQANVEGFRWKYKDQQFAVVQPDPCGDIGQFVTNPGDATIQGVNVDLVYKLTADDTLRGSVEYTDATYDRFSFTQLGLGAYAPAFGSRCTAAAARPGFFTANCQGQQLPRTPEWAANIGYEHRFALGNGELVFGIDSQIASSRWLDFSYISNSRAPAYTVVNAQLTYNAPDDRWSVSLYGTNLTDETVYTTGTPHSVVAPNGAPYLVTTIQPPRMFGARLRYNFGG